MQVTTEALGNVGMTQTVCDNPKCGKSTPVVRRSLDGKIECCSNACLKQVEEMNMEPQTTEVEVGRPNGAAAMDAPAPKAKKGKKTMKKAAKAAAKAAPTKKVAAKAKAAPAKKAAANGNRMTGEEKIKVLRKDHTFRGARIKMFSLMKNGITTKSAVDALEEAGYGRYSGFLHICKDAGLITWA